MHTPVLWLQRDFLMFIKKTRMVVRPKSFNVMIAGTGIIKQILVVWVMILIR